ncbi:MAG: DUF1292 domain-containing protein [Lachnoclostridium sp.]|jgi:hypothetical protein
MEDKNNKVTFTGEENEQAEFYVLEQTQLNGHTYLLVTDSDEQEDDEETTAYILRETVTEEDETFYELVEDEEELALIAQVFEELLEDVDIET